MKTLKSYTKNKNNDQHEVKNDILKKIMSAVMYLTTPMIVKETHSGKMMQSDVGDEINWLLS